MILVVDDDEMNLRMAEFILKQGSYEARKATSGEEGLVLAAQGGVDLILLDIEMPGMNGIETAEKLRTAEETKNIPIIFLTASPDEESMAAAERLGVLGCVKKPFLPPELLAKIKEVLA